MKYAKTTGCKWSCHLTRRLHQPDESEEPPAAWGAQCISQPQPLPLSLDLISSIVQVCCHLQIEFSMTTLYRILIIFFFCLRIVSCLKLIINIQCNSSLLSGIMRHVVKCLHQCLLSDGVSSELWWPLSSQAWLFLCLCSAFCFVYIVWSVEPLAICGRARPPVYSGQVRCVLCPQENIFCRIFSFFVIYE